MLNRICRLNKFYVTTIISLLICAMFLSYYNINYTVKVFRKPTESENPISRFLNNETYAKTNDRSSKLKFSANKLTDTDKEETIPEEELADIQYNTFEKKWLIYYLNIFIILSISIIILYAKGWFIKVSRLRYQLYQVHYIQLKDGKKDALSYCLSL